MPGTATQGWTTMRETGPATDREIAAGRVKGGALGLSLFHFMTEVC